MKHASRLLASAVAAFSTATLATGALAASVTLPLDPGHSQVLLRGYAFGLTPNNGQFKDYSGTLTLDPPNIDTCTVDMTLQAKSLAMSMGMVTKMVLAEDFLDPAKYPTLAFHGACKSNGPDKLPTLVGTLTMHGETHPFSMDVTYKDSVLTTSGKLKREEWNVNGSQTVIGDTVKVTVVVRLPDSIKFNYTPSSD